MSRGRFPLSGGNGRRPKGVGMMSRSDRGDRERWHGEAVTDEGTGFGFRLLCAEGILLPQALFAGGFRRLRAASYFAHGGSSSQWPRPPSLVPSGQFTLSPLHSVSAWRRKLRSFPCSSSSRQTRCAGLRRERRGIGQNAPGDAADGLRLRCAPPRSIGPPPYPLCRYATSPPDRGSRPRTPDTGVTP